MSIAVGPVHFTPPRAPVGEVRLVDPALLLSKPQGLMVEYTSRCNLRCKYCSKSNPATTRFPGRDMDMSGATIDQALAVIARERFSELLLAGTGETTFHRTGSVTCRA